MKLILAASAGLCLAASISGAAMAQSQAAVVQTQPSAVLEAPNNANILRSGTEVPLITREDLTTKKKKLRVGQRIQMEVAASVTMNNVTVIPAGTPAIAEITEVRNKGMWGKSGYIGARVLSMRVGERNIRLSGSFDDKGITGTGGVVAAIAFVPIAGFLTTGTSAHIPTGSAVKAFLDEDVAFAPAAAKPVLEVPVAAASASAQ